ncbi:MAG: DEAD/DEAH box helicase [Deltaproteobacteria bacterium]|nr:DEAD/DEAH box helicase [Deltaproteobacteria bacterium]
MLQFIENLKRHRFYKPQVVCHQAIPSQAGQWVKLETAIPPLLHQALQNLHIDALYSHQAKAIQKIREGKNVVMATPTASGKTLTYTLPVIESILETLESKALYIFPLKALEQDQLKALKEFTLPIKGQVKFPAAIYDGDTSSYRRRKIRESVPAILITNPDMLHLSLLPFHTQWEALFRNLRYVIIDELHTYKGIFGSHLAQVIRRMERICDFYGSRPQFVACSATIANPRSFAERLTGLPFEAIEESGAPRAGRNFLFLNPTGSPYTLAAKLFLDCLDNGFRTLAFTQARKITELLHTWILQDRPDLRGRVSSYRAGFLPEERREIEAKLVSGELLGVISTSALELGIDIGGLDVCILVGYPGTITATWQRGGRVGRTDRESLVALIAQPDALDQYFMRHPQDFFGRGFESAVVDPDNSVVVSRHLICASAEIPLRMEEEIIPLKNYGALLDQLVAEGELLRSASGKEWFSRRINPHRMVDIRSAGEGFTIFEEGTKRLIGKSNVPRVYNEGHPGAIYLHKADPYLVTQLDQGKKEVWVKQADVDYYTRALSEKETEILSVVRTQHLAQFTSCYGRLKVTERVRGFEKRRIFGQDLLSVHELEMPAHVFETMGLWIILPEGVSQRVKEEGLHFMGGIHAVEHASIALFPLFALCDRNDVGGICYPVHPQLEKPAIFIYDGYPGGVGLAEYGYGMLEELLKKTLSLIQDCPCLDGCPSCVHSPKCGSGNKPLDKRAAKFILEWLLGEKGPEKRGAEKIRKEPFPSSAAVLLPVDSEISDPRGDMAATRRPAWLKEEISRHRVLFLDIETQRSAEEVGGWQNKHLMRLAVAVIYDSLKGSFDVFKEDGVHDLIAKLKTAELIVGFNIADFDYNVLRGYSSFGFSTLKTFDILQQITSKLGYRLSLNHLAHKTLNMEKSANGLQSLQWFKEGKIGEVIAYCQKDVEITRDLFLFGLANGYLLFETKAGQRVRLPVEWDLSKIIKA